MRAIIQAGGKGTRMLPYTQVIPKPLLPVGGYPVIEILVRQLVDQGFDHITVTCGHLACLLRAFLGDGSRWGAKIDYTTESQPLGTIGALQLVPDLPDRFIVVNGDTLSNIAFADVLDRGAAYAVTVVTAKIEIEVPLGAVDFDWPDVPEGGAHKIIGEVSGFYEKPTLDYVASTGVYAMNREVLNWISPNLPLGFDELMRGMIGRDPVGAYPHYGIWLDLGTPAEYQRAERVFAESRATLLKGGA